MLRAVRRRADVSQRELAALAGVPQTTVSRIESGAAGNPSFRTVERLVSAAGCRIVVEASPTDASSAVSPSALTFGPAAPGTPIPHEDWRDGAGRRYPAHLDVVELTRPERWWGAWWASTTIRQKWPLDQVPAVTFDRSRSVRDERRRRAALGAQAIISGGRRQLTDGRWAWVWTAEAADCGGTECLGDSGCGGVVGELWAHEFDEAGDGERWSVRTVPAGTVVLDGVAVLPCRRLAGIGRRLVEAMRRATAGPVIVLGAGTAGRGFLEACGFRVAHAVPAPSWYLLARGPAGNHGS
jgi:transcriptional regulator with XRE-family HTH domain/GNAT superfamily N-acetyltransferase